MQAITTIGLDIAKSVFQVHGMNAHFRPYVLSIDAERALKAKDSFRECADTQHSQPRLCCGAIWSLMGWPGRAPAL